jgi:hypothetical protein
LGGEFGRILHLGLAELWEQRARAAGDWVERKRAELAARSCRDQPDARRFAHPYYWAGCILSGAPAR